MKSKRKQIADELGYKIGIKLPEKYKIICTFCEKIIKFDNLLGYYCDECGYQLLRIEIKNNEKRGDKINVKLLREI